MTYCVAIRVKEGLVFASDSRTSAGVDDVKTYSKMHIFNVPGDRIITIMSAGNLSTTQSVMSRVRRDFDQKTTIYDYTNLHQLGSMYDIAEYIGRISQQVQQVHRSGAEQARVGLESSFLVGGQVRGSAQEMFLVYPLGNCITTAPNSPYLQIGESKYGKPILDRIIRPEISMEDAARCALVSLDSTMRSNLSVGPPVELVMVKRDALNVSQHLKLDTGTPYYQSLKSAWGQQLERAFLRLPRFDWETPVPADQQ